MENEESKTNEHESKDLTASVSDDESVGDVSSALLCGPDVCVYCDSHSNISRDDRGESSNYESDSCIGIAKLRFCGKEDQCAECQNKEH